jgi:anaerobic selenocysteine-containing dehydrogenase
MERSFRTICSYCHTSCGLVVKVSDGKIVKVQGDPDHPASKGYHCKKAEAAISVIYHPDRLKTPLMKAKGGFKRVTWDEALAFAADKLISIKDQYGAKTLVRAMGAPFTYECRDGFAQFLAAYGSTRTTGVRHLCATPREMGITGVLGGRIEQDYRGTKLAIFWGANVIAVNRYSVHSALADFPRTISNVKKGGGKIVVIDPVRSESVRFADEWIPLRLGTDLALALAMIHVIIQDEIYDREFVQDYTLGFDQLKNHVIKYTPEWAAKHTGLSPETIRNLAREYAKSTPGVILDGNGLDMHAQGVEACRAIAMLQALTGNVDRPGSNVFMPWSKQSAVPTFQPAKDPGEKTPYPLFPDYPYQVVMDSLLSEREDRPRAMIVTTSNPALVLANSQRTRQAMGRLELLIVHDHFMTATAEMADLVLPDAAGFERNGYRAFASADGCFFAFRRKIIEPLGECRPVFEVEYCLAEKMGMAKDYPFRNNEEWIDFKVKPSGISMHDLEEKQIVYTTPPVRYEKFKTQKLGTPSGKVEFFSERFQKAGYDPMPTFRERKDDPGLKGRFPLDGTCRKPGIYTHTQFRNIPGLSKRQPMPFAWIHPMDASARGIENGSWVEVESPHGKIALEARTEEKAPQGVVVVDFGWGNPWDKGANVNVLTDDQDRDPISNGTSNRLFRCEVRKKKKV